MSQTQTQKGEEWITIFYKYISCSGKTSGVKFNVAINTNTLEMKYLTELVRESRKGPKHNTVTCSKKWHLQTKLSELERLEREGWIFKEVSMFRGAVDSVIYWAPTAELEVDYGMRDEKGWHDVVKVNGKTLKIYRNHVEVVN